MRGDISEFAQVFRAPLIPALAVDRVDSTTVWSEAIETCSGLQDVFANCLDVDATRLGELEQRAFDCDFCVGVCAEAAMGHRKSSETLVAHGSKERWDSE